MKFNLITIFPEIFENVLKYGIVGKAYKNKVIDIKTINPRDFTSDVRQRVDDKTYGGGAGMVMMPEPLFKAIQDVKKKARKKHLVIFLSPQGRPLKQSDAIRFSSYEELTLVCGRYEGIDERIISTEIDEELSIGDYVLSGGELPALVFIDVLTRLIPGVLNTESSYEEDSFSSGLLDYPHYTRPENFNGMPVPEVLLSGNHANIKKWREMMALKATLIKRPDILNKLALTDEQVEVLNKIKDQLLLEEKIK